MHGSITEQKQVELDNAKRLYERLFTVVTSLAECMNQKMPVLVEVRFTLLTPAYVLLSGI